MIIEKLIAKYSNDLNYRYDKIVKEQTTEEDLILLFRDLSEIIKIITKLRDTLNSKLEKFITKN